MSAPGKVYLVGAGPGHPELLTLKAARLIESAGVIVYDRLIQEEVLAMTAPSCERIYMGKPLGRHDSRQDEIHQILLRKSREGKMVVRLKGGDPFLFGRGGEEAEFLAEHGVPFEVIPGVSSSLAAPASAGIAVTHRDMASAVAIVTGHEAGEESRLDWRALSRIDTLVFLMAVHNAGRIARKLIECGRSPGTPAAMVQMAFWDREDVVTGTLADIANKAVEAGIQPPATFVVGEVVLLRRKLEQLHRDLRRRPVSTPGSTPAPGPGPLFRLATSRIASEALALALELDLFDSLEEPRTAVEVARSCHLNEERTRGFLASLAALGLIESLPEGFRNLELASLYLRRSSPRSLVPIFACQLRRPEVPLARYLAGEDGAERFPGTDCVRCSEAAAVLNAGPLAASLDLPPDDRVLLMGWAGHALEASFRRRWPGLRVDVCNPFLGDGVPDARYGAVIVSCGISACQPGGIDGLLRAASERLEPDGLLCVQDLPLCGAAPGAPEFVLARLGRPAHNGVDRGGCEEQFRDQLGALGFASTRSRELPGAGVLLTATKTP